MINLRWEDVDLDKNQYDIQRTKTYLSAWYPMHSNFRNVIKALASETTNVSGYVFKKWRHPDTISHVVKEILSNAGYGHLSLHKLRHTFAVLLKSENVDDATIGKLLGHTDRRATEIYAHVSDESARDALLKIKTGPIDMG